MRQIFVLVAAALLLSVAGCEDTDRNLVVPPEAEAVPSATRSAPSYTAATPTTVTEAPEPETSPPQQAAAPPPPPDPEPEPADECHPSYDPCVPIASDVDCEGGSGDGPEYTGQVRVVGPDEYGLDRDNDGIGCE